MAWTDLTPHRRGLLIGGLVGLVAVVLVLLTLQRPAPPMYAPSPMVPDSAGNSRVGPITRTVDATASDAWTYFSFQAGTVVRNPGPTDWDLAFRRFQVIANGGRGFFGEGGILDLGEVPFDSVRTIPSEGYVPTVARGDSVNAAIREWYDYSFLSHLLFPRPRVYAVRTANGRLAKLELLGYYCPGAQPGCVTFRYVYAGDGSTKVEAGKGADPATLHLTIPRGDQPPQGPSHNSSATRSTSRRTRRRFPPHSFRTSSSAYPRRTSSRVTLKVSEASFHPTTPPPPSKSEEIPT